MKRTAWIAGTWLAVGVLGGTGATAADPPAAAAGSFTLTSPNFSQGGTIALAQVFNGFGCKGGNRSPALTWKNAPQGTQSFALLVHDPDAPTGSGWWHWAVYNIPATATSLAEGAGDPTAHTLPAGAVQGNTDFGSPGYGGPCPPPGKPHHYYFRLYALKVEKLELPPQATGALISYNVKSQAIATAELMGLYGR